MGLFGKKTRHPLEGLQAYDVRRGTGIPLVDVEPGFVEFVRSTTERKPKVGHEAPIALVLRGNDVVAYWDDQAVARMDPEMVGHYRDEFVTLEKRKKFARTVVLIRAEGMKSPHAVSLNWGLGAYDGGILRYQ